MANELILIIEDNEKNRKLVRDVLQVKGYKTVETETAEEGIKLAIEQLPALILMDIQLPGMDGITALKRLKADATNEKHTGHRRHSIGHDVQAADDVS
ncbi:MAG TPA: response regulator [Candidatus Binatia bacterium]